MKTKPLFLKTIAFLLMISALSACMQKKSSSSADELANTDRFYSELSAKKGMNAAFLAMFDSAGVMLQANRKPVEGIVAIRSLLMSETDSSFILTWKPLFTRIANSGEMGYTYGTYRIVDRATDSVSGVGKYATIWEKKSDGTWKAILDTGNPGLGEFK